MIYHHRFSPYAGSEISRLTKLVFYHGEVRHFNVKHEPDQK